MINRQGFFYVFPLQIILNPMFRFTTGIMLFLVFFETMAQNDLGTKPRKSQLVIRLDNDAFVSGRQDRYYSSGHYLTFYHYLGKGKSLSIGFGNQIFTSDLRKELEPEEIDRPFAGVNYLKFGFQKRKPGQFARVHLLGS